MIQSKYLGRVAAVLAVLLVIGSIFMVMAVENGEVKASQPECVTNLFGFGIMNIEIEADKDTWQSMLDNAQAEEYIMVNVTVNGVEYKDVGIRAKGNSSLSQVASFDSDRYSFRLKFNEYIKGQTCFGLESFVVNNVMGDSSYMKEYISYDIMKYIGVNTTLVEYANISLNGENWGFYLAVEGYDEEFVQLNYGDSSGQLYSVKMSGMGGMDINNNGQMLDFQNMPQDENMTQDGGFGGMGGGFGGMAAGFGGSLEYTDDNISSYASIFENAVTKADESDNKRVIEALKELSEGQDLEKYFDVDQILRYFAAHTVVVNLDSYSSTMAQNYYIYEKNGKLSMLPWDYGLAADCYGIF